MMVGLSSLDTEGFEKLYGRYIWLEALEQNKWKKKNKNYDANTFQSGRAGAHSRCIVPSFSPIDLLNWIPVEGE